MINRNTQVTVPVIEGQYRFSLEEALNYCASRAMYYKLEYTLLYNIPLRDELRNVGMEAFISELKSVLPDNEQLAENLDRIAENNANTELGNLDIQLYSINDSFTVLGHTFQGLQELKDREEMYAWIWYREVEFHSKKAVSDSPHVGELYENYPCFDSYDFANEKRTYQNYIIRSKPIKEEDLRKVYDAPNYGNIEKVREDMPLDILPLVYYKGDGDFIKVATRKE